jgi:hypothetical protein
MIDQNIQLFIIQLTPPSSPSRWLIKQAIPHDVPLTHTTLGPGNSIGVPIKSHFYEPIQKIFAGLKRIRT